MRTIGRHSLNRPGDKIYPFRNRHKGAKSEIRESTTDLTELAQTSKRGQESRGLFTCMPQRDDADAESPALEQETQSISPRSDNQQATGSVPSEATPDEQCGAISNVPLIEVDTSALSHVNVKPTFGTYLSEIWQRRQFIWADARLKAFRTTRDYRLWRFWMVVQPLLDAAMYGFLFGVILKTNRGIDNFIGFVVLGVSFFAVMTRIINSAPGLVKNSRSLVQSFNFPRATVVFSQVLRMALDCLLACGVSIVFSLAMQPAKPVSWTIVLVVPIFMLMVTFATGVLFILARISAFIPDVKAIISVVVRAWFFTSGIFYSIDRFVDNPVMEGFLKNNPGYIYINAVRESIISGAMPPSGEWV